MRPYKNRLEWNLKSGPLHALDGLMDFSNALPARKKAWFDRRAQMLRRSLALSVFVSIPLYLGAIITALGQLALLIPAITELNVLLATLYRTMFGITGVLLFVFLAVRRRITQLQADLVTFCISHR